MGMKYSESDQSSSIKDQDSFSFNSSGIGIFSDGEIDLSEYENYDDQYIEIEIPFQSPITTNINYNYDGDDRELDQFDKSPAVDRIPAAHTTTSGVERAVLSRSNIQIRSRSSYRENISLVPSEVAGINGRQRNVVGQPAFNKGNWEPIRSRKSSNTGGVRRFIIKIRSLKSMIWSKLNAKPQQLRAMQSAENVKNKPPRVLNLDAFNKMFNAITKNMTVTRKSKQAATKSCPASVITSPIHDLHVPDIQQIRRNLIYSRDNSVQAAIAHCKRSFGQ